MMKLLYILYVMYKQCIDLLILLSWLFILSVSLMVEIHPSSLMVEIHPSERLKV